MIYKIFVIKKETPFVVLFNKPLKFSSDYPRKTRIRKTLE